MDEVEQPPPTSVDDLYVRAGDAFVSFVTGHLVSPRLETYYGGGRVSSFPAEDLATLVHELTHHFSLTAPLSQVVAFLAASSTLNRSFDDFASAAPTGEGLDALLGVVRPRHFDACFPHLMAGLRWLLEGLAVYAQADWFPEAVDDQSDQQRVHVSELSMFFLAIFHQDAQHPETPRGHSPPYFLARLRDKLQALHAGRPYFLELLADTRTRAVPYYAGYVLLRTLQRRLAAKDRRLLGPSLFLTFLTGCFLNDRRLLSIALIPDAVPPEQVAEATARWIAGHLADRIRALLAVDPARLGLVLDVLDVPDPTPARACDVAASLDLGRIEALPLREMTQFIADLPASRFERSVAYQQFADRHRHFIGGDAAGSLTSDASQMLRAFMPLTQLIRLANQPLIVVGHLTADDGRLGLCCYCLAFKRWLLVPATQADVHLLSAMSDEQGCEFRDLNAVLRDHAGIGGTGWESVLTQAVHPDNFDGALDADGNASVGGRRYIGVDSYVVYSKVDYNLWLLVTHPPFVRLRWVAGNPPGDRPPLFNVEGHLDFSRFFDPGFATSHILDPRSIPAAPGDGALLSAWRAVFGGATGDDELMAFWTRDRLLPGGDVDHVLGALIEAFCADRSLVTRRDGMEHARAQRVNDHWRRHTNEALIAERLLDDGRVELRLLL